MAKTYEAMMKAEEEGRKKLAEGIVRRPLPTNHGPELDGLEEYYRLKQNILSNHSGEKVKALLFSSSTEKEGNSTVLINFAMTLSSGGERVLLVDANLRNPSFHKAFNVERENGLTDLFLGKSTLEEVIKRTQFNNLSIITSGSHSNPFSIFESNFLDSHIAKMKAEADWVLFDSPPINFLNDSIFLAPKVDGVVMVIEAEKTRWEVAQSAKQRIEAGNGKILGVILNKRKFYIPNWLYRTL